MKLMSESQTKTRESLWPFIAHLCIKALNDKNNIGY